MANVGFLGLGSMGTGMAARLLAAGHRVRVYNRSPGRAGALLAAGAVLADTPRLAAQGAEVVIAMVSDDAASRQVWLGEEGALAANMAADAVIVECSTLSYDWVQKLARTVAESGYNYLDCPVTGLPDAAAAGSLTLFTGGDKATIAQVQPVLDAISKAQIHFGEIGAGTSYKLIVNLMGSVQILATADAMALAEKSGLDLQQVSDALASGPAGSANVVRCAQQMVNARYGEDVPFSAGLRLKDTEYGVALAQIMGQESGLGVLARDAFRKTVDAGFASLSESKVIDTLGQ